MGLLVGTGKEKVIAFLLSGFVMPGAGQLYLKRKVRGAILSSATVMIVFYPLFNYLRSFKAATADMAQGDMALLQTVTAMSTAWESQKGSTYICTLILLGFWLYGLLDILFGKGRK